MVAIVQLDIVRWSKTNIPLTWKTQITHNSTKLPTVESNRFEVQGIPIVDVIQTEIPQSGSQAKQTNSEVALSEVQVSDTQGTQIPDDRKSQQFWSLWGMNYHQAYYRNLLNRQ